MNALHFARATPLPDAVRDWHRLGELAAQLRGSRARAYPAMIADGRMTAADAATRLRIITAIAAQWDAVLRGQALPPVEDYRESLGADAAEMLDECADIANRASSRAAADPAKRQLADQAMLARALHWHQQPINDGAIHPHIWIAHDFHQWQRHSSKGSVMARVANPQGTLPFEWQGGRRLLWVDGANSAVMAFLLLQEDRDAIPVHCDLGDSVHEDSHRFVDDLENWYGKPIVRLRSDEYANVDEVFEDRKYLSGMNGAPCTGAMKVVPRMNFQMPSDIHFWGYTADKRDARLVIIGTEKGTDGKKRNIRCFPDEIPANWPTKVRGADVGGCGFHCSTDNASAGIAA